MAKSLSGQIFWLEERRKWGQSINKRSVILIHHLFCANIITISITQSSSSSIKVALFHKTRKVPHEPFSSFTRAGQNIFFIFYENILESALFFMEILIAQVFSPVAHPSGGETERKIQELTQFIKHLNLSVDFIGINFPVCWIWVLSSARPFQSPIYLTNHIMPLLLCRTHTMRGSLLNILPSLHAK